MSESTLSAVTPLLKARTLIREHLDACLEAYGKAREGLDDLATGRRAARSSIPRPPLGEQATDDAVFTFDVGTPTIWAAVEMNGKRRMIGSLAHGSMANALPQAIGAQAAYPDRQIISMSGDGGCDANGRFPDARATDPAGEGGDLQQFHARICRHGDEGFEAFSKPGPLLKNRTLRGPARAAGVLQSVWRSRQSWKGR